MCTLSWIINDSGYEVFFNRDEQRSRQVAIAPSLINNAIMPIDPQSQGTWIASSIQGITLCLLNNYQMQDRMDQDSSYISRGKLIPEIIQSSKEPGIKIETLNLENFMPFFLCIFPKDLKSGLNSVSIYQWDGTRLSREQTKQPFISSGVSISEVKTSRTETFSKIIVKNGTPQEHLAYHASHIPEKNYLSVCMHREDARTQSLCHITVNNEITFRYHDGPPCKNNRWTEIKHMKKKK